MSFDSGGFLDDIMEDMIYPESKWYAVKQGIILLFFYPILVLVVMPLSYFISFFLGFFSASPNRKCDACGKNKPHNVRSLHKFYWFCEDCLKKYNKLEDKFMRGKR